MAKVYLNRAWMNTATTGTGTITLGTAVTGYLTFAEAGATNGDTLTYVIRDGSDFELGVGTYTSSGTTLSRDTVIVSEIAGVSGTTKLTLSGSADVFAATSVADLVFTDKTNTLTANQIIQVTDNTNAALRVTQLGTGLALLIEDSTNPDSSPFYIDNGGRVFSGPTNSTDPGSKLLINSGTTSGDNYQVGIAPESGALGRNSGLILGATFSDGWGGGDTAVRYSGAIVYGASGGTSEPRDWSMRFFIGNTSDVPVERARIDRDGSVRTYTNSGANPGAVVARHWTHLTADYTLTSTTSEQKAFNNPTNGELTLATGVYEFECFLYLTTMSATTGNFAFDPIGAGTAVVDRFGYLANGIDNSSPLNAGTRTGSASVTQQSPASVVTAGTGTGAVAQIRGMFRVSTGGTIIPSVSLVTAAAAVVKAGSYFKCAKIGESSETYVGAWT